MPNFPSDITVNVIITALSGGVVSAVVSGALASRRSTKEKLWDLRRVAYGSILSELLSVEHTLNIARGYIAEDEIQYFYSAASKGHNRTIETHIAVVRKTYSDSYLILSPSFIKVFSRMLYVIDDENYNMDPPEIHEAFDTAIRRSRAELLEQAKSEMPGAMSIWLKGWRIFAWASGILIVSAWLCRRKELRSASRAAGKGLMELD